MTDNVTITQGTGTTVATDNIGGVNYQRVKMVWGADGTATDLSAAAPLPVVDAGSGITVSRGISGAVVTSADASTATAVTDAPTSGQKLVIHEIVWSVGSTAIQVDFEIETAGTTYYTFYCAANTSYQFVPRGKWKLETADKKLMVDTSAAGAISVTVSYSSEA